MSFIGKTKYYLKLRKIFRNSGEILADGYYIVNDKNVEQIKEHKVPFFKKFRVKCSRTRFFRCTKGNLIFTQYKFGLLTEDKALYFINTKKRYNEYKKNYNLYKARLMYPSISLEFVDRKRLIIAPMVKGLMINDDSRFDIFLKFIFDIAKTSSFEMKPSHIHSSLIELPWYVQHGDCKNSNIIWDNNCYNFTMIDLEAINLYPPLYDVFYYLFITKKESSISILKSVGFKEQVKDFYTHIFDVVPDNIVDITLANYAYFTSSKLAKGLCLYEFEFYLYWRKYDSFDEFPLTKQVLLDYEVNLRTIY